MKVRLAVIDAVDKCIKDDVLSDFFIKHRDEVIDVSIFEYDEEGVMDVMREEGRADATLKDIRNIMTKLNKSADEAMDILDVPIKERESLFSLLILLLIPFIILSLYHFMIYAILYKLLSYFYIIYTQEDL